MKEVFPSLIADGFLTNDTAGEDVMRLTSLGIASGVLHRLEYL